MQIVYGNGFDLLLSGYNQLVTGQTKLLLFFLASQYDRSVLKDLSELSADIDSLTGPFCIAVAFMPPLEKDMNYLKRRFDLTSDKLIHSIRWRPGMLPINSDRTWEQYEISMTQGAYEVARFFNIQVDEMPCLLFLCPEEKQEFVLLSLKNKSLRDIYPSLRKIFANWYEKNPQLPEWIELQSLATALPLRPTYKNISLPTPDNQKNRLYESRWTLTLISPWVQKRMDTMLRDDVVPIVCEALENALLDKSRNAKRRGNGIQRALTANPRQIEPLTKFMRRYNIFLQFNGEYISSRDLPDIYNKLYKEKVMNHCQTKLKKIKDIPPFPLDEIKSLDMAIQLKCKTRDFVNKGKKIKEDVDWLSGLIKLILRFIP